MTKEDLCYTPATELAQMIRTKAISPVEVVGTVLERIEALNPKLNAICTLTADAAMDAARRAEAAVAQGAPLGPLHGVPVTIKDMVVTKGVRTMFGSFIHEHNVPDFDAPVVTRLKEAGAIVLGKTAVPEFGWKALSDSPVTGATHNPWKHGMTAGGSSSGAASACAAGLGPLHQGSDGAGSVRIPAAFCGIFGLKPSFGRIPYYPTANNDNTSHIGPMTRTVADGALMLQVMAGQHDWDSVTLEGPAPDYVGKLHAGVKGLHVAYSPDFGNLRVDPEVAQAARKAAAAFEELGCTVEEVADPGFGDSFELIHFFWAAHEAGKLGPLLDEWGDRMDPGLVACTRAGMHYTATEYLQKRAEKLAYWDRVRPLFERYDLLLSPSISVAAFPVGELIPKHWEQHDWDWLRWGGFSYPFNLTRQPSATVPAGFTADGLPVGLQITGRRYADLTVMQASAAYEQARPWAQHRPTV